MIRLPPGFVALCSLLCVVSFARAQRGDAPNAKILSAEEEQQLFHLPPGFAIQLVAAEPEIQKPLNLNFDAAGRLWVSGTELYPWPATTDAVGEPIASFQKNLESNALAFRPGVTPPPPSARGLDTVRVLSDFDPRTGRARKSSLFADGLNIPIGVVPLPRRPGARGDTIIAYSIPSIWRFEDTDGDGRADKRERLYTEFGFKDTHGMVSNFTYWVDGWIYGTHGYNNHSEIRDAAGNLTVLDSGNTYRFRPDGSHFEQWTHGQTNPFGLAFDPHGDVYTADSHSKPVYLLVHGGYYEGINRRHDGLGFAPSITLDDHGSSAIGGIAYYAATHFPKEFQGNLFNGNPVTRRVNRDRLEWTGSTPKAIRMPDFLTSDDPAFRPVQVKLGPDGALWIADFYNPIIGHYEVPLTHPSRDHGHGRIWRIVWHGEDNSVPAPLPPDISKAAAPALVENLRDNNLVVRALATNELVDRIGPGAAIPALRTAADKVPDETALEYRFTLERLGAQNDETLFAALRSATSDSGPALTALRILASRPTLGPVDEKFFDGLISRSAPGHLWRATADIFATRPQPWQARLVLAMLGRTPEADRELVYALRLALKAQVAIATPEQLTALGKSNAGAADFLADVAVAVKTPAAAEFLLGYIEDTKFSVARAGEFARHALTELPPDRLKSVEPLVRALTDAPVAQRLALAEGLAAASRVAGRPLPAEANAWMRRTLVDCFSLPEAPLATRAIDATKDLTFTEKEAPLRAIVLNQKRPPGVRSSAIKALARDRAAVTTLTTLMTRGTEPINLRRNAAEQLTVFATEGDADIATAVRTAFAAALPTAQSELAIVIATGLAKSEAGAEQLVTLVTTGKAPATLLRHRFVASALEARPPAVRARAAELTKQLPSEDARLDLVINTRVNAFAGAKPNAAHGAQVFTTYCSTCHRVGNTGGNIGPSLDGIGSRGVQRVIEDILDPNRNVDPAFRLASLTLKTGEVRSGMNLREQGGAWVLTDPGTAQDIVLPKTTVASTAPSGSSPMPPMFETVIPENDFFDLLGFLVKPGQ